MAAQRRGVGLGRTSRRRRCRSTCSPRSPRPATSGRPATGAGIRAAPTTSGCPAPGSRRRPSACSGRPATGAGAAAATCWHGGYWGPHVGFYGGVNYGYGYGGYGYHGGYWRGGVFNYNRSVNHINERVVHNVYNERVVENNNTRVSFNGGQGGIGARESAEERAAHAEHHFSPTPMQHQHEQVAMRIARAACAVQPRRADDGGDAAAGDVAQRGSARSGDARGCAGPCRRPTHGTRCARARDARGAAARGARWPARDARSAAACGARWPGPRDA